jgi:hypothetical protein
MTPCSDDTPNKGFVHFAASQQQAARATKTAPEGRSEDAGNPRLLQFGVDPLRSDMVVVL